MAGSEAPVKGGLGGLKALPPKKKIPGGAKKSLPAAAGLGLANGLRSSPSTEIEAAPAPSTSSAQLMLPGLHSGRAGRPTPSGEQVSTAITLVRSHLGRGSGDVMQLARDLRGNLMGVVPAEGNGAGSGETAGMGGTKQQQQQMAGSGNVKLDPRTYYEPVEPSDWQPEDDSYLALYRRAYCSRADLAIAPLFVALLAGLAQLRLVPLWALVLLAPLLLVATVFFIVKVASVSPRDIASGRLACVFAVLMKLMVPAVFCMRVLPHVPERFAAQLALATSNTAAIVLHFWCIASDPGFVPKGSSSTADAERGKAVQQQLQHDDGSGENKYCETCCINRPLRSKHCRACNRCVERLDHHCPVINNCVGANNMRAFVLYLMAMLTGQWTFVHLTSVALWRQARHQWEHLPSDEGAALPLSAKLSALSQVCNQQQGLALLVISVAVLSLVAAWLVGRCLVCIAGNVTFNELACRAKYSYLQNSSGSSSNSSSPGGVGDFVNRFDAGPAANCLQFWTSGLEDWRAARQPAAVAAVQNHTPPVGSVSTAVRLWDKRKKLIAEARTKRQQDKEEWLLRTYGGVNGSSQLAMQQQQQAQEEEGHEHHHACRGCDSSYLAKHQAATCRQ